MRRHIWICVMLGLLIAVDARAEGFTPPTPEQMAMLSSAPASIADLIKGATPGQAAGVLTNAIGSVDKSTLTDDQKKQLMARLVAYAVVQMGSRAPDMMAIVVRGVPDRWLQLVVATAMVAAPDYANAMRREILAALGAETDKGKLAEAAASDPHAILGDLLYQLIVVIARRSATVTPRFDLRNLPPPEVPQSILPPPPPPPPHRYPAQ